jgi:hypothetical protein
MAKTRIHDLANELKLDVKELLRRLKDEYGVQERLNYLTSLDDSVVSRVRESISAAAIQVEELRVGENIKRRRRVAPAPAAVMEAAPEAPSEVKEAPAPEPPKKEAKPSPVKEVARVVTLPSKKKVRPEPSVPVEEVKPATVEKAKVQKEAAAVCGGDGSKGSPRGLEELAGSARSMTFHFLFDLAP